MGRGIEHNLQLRSIDLTSRRPLGPFVVGLR